MVDMEDCSSLGVPKSVPINRCQSRLSPIYCPASYVYDAENRLIATGGYSYIYDGDGQRVEKCTQGTMPPGTCATGATGTLYWRGLGSDPLSETNLAGTFQNAYVFFNGQRVARIDNAVAVHYYFSDHLGSHGVVESATGTTCEQDIDYYPYGGVEHDYCATVPQNYKFTGKERDSESGLDNFGARYNASSIGRFMTPDWAAKPTNVPYAHFGNPQSLNLYAYVGNNPMARFDPDGHIDCSGKNAQGLVCQYLANWNANHGISPTAKKSDAPGVPVKLPNGKTVPDPHSKTGVLMSPTADLRNVAAAGKEIKRTTELLAASGSESSGFAIFGYVASALKSDVQQNGDFDYQRTSFVSGDLQQLSQFRDVSNFNVGLLGQQAGLSLDELLTAVGDYASLNSSNSQPGQPYGLDPQTRELTVAGYQVGASGAYGQ